MLSGKSKTKIGRRKSGLPQKSNTQFVEPLMLDKKDEIWCYVLIKLFTAILEDPEEADRLLKPTKSAFDIDLQPAVQQLKVAIEKKKSETSQVYNALQNVSSILTTSKTAGSTVIKPSKGYEDGDSSPSSSISSSSSSSNESSDDEDDTNNTPQTASHSIWTQSSVGDSLRRLASVAAHNTNTIRMEEVFKLLSSYSGKNADLK